MILWIYGLLKCILFCEVVWGIFVFGYMILEIVRVVGVDIIEVVIKCEVWILILIYVVIIFFVIVVRFFVMIVWSLDWVKVVRNGLIIKGVFV